MNKENLNRIKVAVLSYGFLDWGGGIDFLKTLIYALVNRKNKFETYVFIPSKPLRFKNKLLEKNTRSIFKIINKYNFIMEELQKRQFNDVRNSVKFVFYDDMNLAEKVKENKIDVVFPAFGVWGITEDFKTPWVGYLYDCQHKYFPDYFDEDEIIRRDEFFNSILNQTKSIVVNSKAAKQDYIKFYGAGEEQIFNLPFAPLLQKSWLKNNPDIIKKYKLPDKYFIISNQFWMHKSHITAFKALKTLKDKGYENIKIVCTGKMEDPRNPDYINGLKIYIRENNLEENIIFLGYIDKRDQIQVMKNAVATIQPTLFEGGPGGGAVFNSLALGVPVILSDIPINKEISPEENVLFFKAQDSEDLSEKIITIINKEVIFKKYTVIELTEKSQKHLNNLSDKIEEIIQKALEVKDVQISAL